MRNFILLLLGLLLIIISITILSDYFCDIVNCQLSITDVIIEFVIAVIMATIFVLAIEFHLKKYRFWKFCKMIQLKITTIKKTKTSKVALAPNTPTKKDVLKIIDFIDNHKGIIMDVPEIEKSVAIQETFNMYKEGLERTDIDMSEHIFGMMQEYVADLITSYKPPRYIVLAANYFGGSTSLSK